MPCLSVLSEKIERTETVFFSPLRSVRPITVKLFANLTLRSIDLCCESGSGTATSYRPPRRPELNLESPDTRDGPPDATAAEVDDRSASALGVDAEALPVWHGPQFVAFRLALPSGFPDIESDLARMLRVLGDDPTTVPLTAISAADERDALLVSLATTLTRARYHRQRFDESVRTLERRRLRVGGTVSADTASPFALFEAAAMLAAARTAVDEVLYIAARRAGASVKDAVDWQANVATTCDLKKLVQYDVSEVASLRSRLSWYQELNEYRNVLVHRGWREQTGGFFPVGSQVAEAADPLRNVFLMPDRTSLLRVRRAHQWTYADGTRLEDVVSRAGIGLEEYLDDVARNTWMGTVPPQGTEPRERHPNIVVQLPHAALVAANGAIYLPLFTTEAGALEFRKTAYPGKASLALFPQLPATSEDGVSPTGFWLSLPGGSSLQAALGGDSESYDLVVALDPIRQVGGAIAGDELMRIPIRDLIAMDAPSQLVKVLDQTVLEAKELFLWRTPS
jgi:hypothetical protein